MKHPAPSAAARPHHERPLTMIAIRILFTLGAANFFFGCFGASELNLAIGAAAALVLWREHRLDAQESRA